MEVEKTTSYLIQQAVRLVVETDRGAPGIESAPETTALWQDVGTVTVPMRSQRKTAVIAAIEKFQLSISSTEPTIFRALDGDALEEIPARYEAPPAPPPVLRVGT